MSASPTITGPEHPAQGAQAQIVTCPHCGQQFPLSEALAEELARHVLAGKEPALREQIARDVSTRYASDLNALQDRLRKQDEEREHDAEVIKKLRDDEIGLRQQRRKLESDQESLRLEKERMRDEIRAQERADADRRAQEHAELELQKQGETHKIQVRELEDKLKRVNDQLEQARRKGVTGSRQEEGFSSQDLFAEELERRFPADEMACTPRGTAGADVSQTVRLGGRECGLLVWECKRAAKWNGAWIGKLAEDATKAGASLAVIVSAELPPGLDGSGLVDGVWVTDYQHALTLAAGLREAIITAWRYKLASAGRDDAASKVYDYIATGGFADRYTAAERALDAQLETLRKEKQYYARSWAQREQQIDKTRTNLTGMVADLIRAGAELPSTALAELPSGELAAVTPGGTAPALPSGSS